MFGHERNNTGDGYGTGGVKASETTSINLTPVRDEPTITPKLSVEERAAVEALPYGSALLVAHSGPNTGARFLLDTDVTTAGGTRMPTSSSTMSRFPAGTWSSAARRAASKSWTPEA